MQYALSLFQNEKVLFERIQRELIYYLSLVKKLVVLLDRDPPVTIVYLSYCAVRDCIHLANALLYFRFIVGEREQDQFRVSADRW